MKNLIELQKENAILQAKLQSIEIKKSELEQSKSQLEQSKSELELENQGLKKLNNWYLEQLKLSRQKKFGASSEKTQYDDEQLTFFNEPEVNRDPLLVEPTEKTIKTPNKKKSRKNMLENLETEVTLYDIVEKACPNCEHSLHLMKQEIRNELVIIPAKIKIVKHLQNVYACRNCEKTDITATIISAKAPKALISKSLVSPSLMSHIMYQKYANAMPLDRQEKDFKRLGVNLSRQNMSNWIIKGAKLLEPLQAELKKELVKNEVLHADETVLEVLNEPGREATTNSYMWLYRTSGDVSNHIVLYDYTMGRGGKFAKEYLEGFKGFLHTDGFAGYHQLEPEITLCGCFAHLRRKFDEALKIISKDNQASSLAQKALNFIGKLFNTEDSIKDFDEKLKFRQEKSKLILNQFYEFIYENENKILPQSLIGKAFTYAKNQKKYLVSFMKDGRIELSNNRAERSIKPFVIGRKNWLFSNSPSGATSSAIVYSIIETAKANGLNPYKYLNFCFEQIQMNKNIDIQNLLPWSEIAINASKN